MFVKPKLGLRVMDPDTWQPLAPEGREVQRTSWWMRRLASGDVVRVDETPAPALVRLVEEPPLEDSYYSDSDEVKP